MDLTQHNTQQLLARIQATLSSSEAELGRSLGLATTYRVGGDAALFVEVASQEDLCRLAELVADTECAVAAIGRGSNLLVADAGYQGVAVHLGEAFAYLEIIDDALVRVGGAASLPVLARRLTADGYAGFEWAVGVPGSVGGAVRMNAGGHGSDMAASVTAVQVVDMGSGRLSTWSIDELELGYRSSLIGPHHVVVSADLQLSDGDPALGEALLTEIVAWRREHQPGGQNAGSVFANPSGDSAGRLIEAAGLKGLRLGTAAVSDKHANFIQADVAGSADDVMALMQQIIFRVREHSGITLAAETRLLGFGAAESSVMLDPAKHHSTPGRDEAE